MENVFKNILLIIFLAHYAVCELNAIPFYKLQSMQSVLTIIWPLSIDFL